MIIGFILTNAIERYFELNLGDVSSSFSVEDSKCIFCIEVSSERKLVLQFLDISI